MINAISHTINSKVGEETSSVEEILPAGVPFENTLDELMLRQNPENTELEELLLLEDEAAATHDDLLEAGALNGSAVPFAPELVARQQIDSELTGISLQARNSGLSRMDILQQTEPLLEEQIGNVGQRIDAHDPNLRKTAENLRNGAGGRLSDDGTHPDAISQLNSAQRIKAERDAEIRGVLAQSVLQRGETLEKDAPSRYEQMQAVLRQNIQSARHDGDVIESMEEQILNAGLLKPGEQAMAVATRAPLESMASLSSKETLSAFEMQPGVERITALETSLSNQSFQPQGLTRAEALTSAQADVSALELPFDVEQVVSRVRVLREQDSQQITLRLQPDHLGRVTMKIRQSGGELRVDMQVDNPMAKQIIESGFDLLRSRFLDQEFAFQELSLNIDINQNPTSQNERESQDFRFDQELTNSSQDVANEEEVPEPGMPHLRQGSGSGLNLYI